MRVKIKRYPSEANAFGGFVLFRRVEIVFVGDIIEHKKRFLDAIVKNHE